MDKYLLNILHEVNTIIIPGIGAFTVTNATTSEIMFMPYLKHDDGKLAKYIAEKEGMSENDAKNLVAKYVREITAILDKGDSYDMYQFGRFVKKDGDINFEEWNSYQHQSTDTYATDLKPDTNSTEESKPKEVVAAKTEESPIETANEVIEELLSTTTQVNEAKSLDDILNKEEQKPEQKEESEKTESQLEEVKAEVHTPIEAKQEEITPIDVSEIKPNENVYIPKEEVKKIAQEQQTKTKEQAPKSKTTKAEPKKIKEKPTGEKKKKNPMVAIVITIAILVLLAGGAYGIFHEQINAAFSGTDKSEASQKEVATEDDQKLEEIENQVELDEQPSEPTVEQENVAQEEVKQAEPVKEEVPTPTNSSSNGSFHIIAGGFGVEANANRMAKKLQSEGASAQVLGKFNELYLVSHSSYASKQEAQQAMQSAGIKGWIFNYNK